jgi:hypothetical protein
MITRGWVDSFVEHHAEEPFETKNIPQENPRLEMARAFLEAAIERFRHHVHSSCAELAFTLHEIGMTKWEDRTERR